MLSVHIGPFASSLERVLLLFAVVVALIVGALLGRRRGVPTSGALMNVVLVGLLFARIGFVLRYFDDYRSDWLGMLDIRDGGFDPLSGVIAAIAAAAWMLLRTPSLRKPLAGALLAGAAAWGITGGLIGLMDSQSRALPQVALRSLHGQSTDLARLAAQGNPMVVNLWATWCPPCRREMPVLAAAQQREPEVTFVFVNQGEGPEEIRRFLNDAGISLENVLLDSSGALGQTVGSMALPTTLFYDADGRLVETHLGELSRAVLTRGLDRARGSDERKARKD